MDIKIGAKLRKLRKDKDITLSELAERTDLSVGFLSNLERDMSSPTLDSLQKICTALNTAMLDILANNHTEEIVIRRDQREFVSMPDGNVTYESVSFGPGCLDGWVISIAPNYRFDKQWAHIYDEIGFVLEGTMTVIMDEKTYDLHEGDCCYIKAMTRHGLSNNTDTPCKSFWVKQITEKNIFNT